MMQRDSGFRKFVAAAVLAAAMAAPQMASAQDAPQGEAPWIKICNKDSETGNEMCIVGKELFAPTGQFITSASLRQITGQSEINLSVAVPPGMLLKPGMRAQIDGGTQHEIGFDICFPNLCVGNVKVDSEFVSGLKAGGQLTISALNQGGNVVAVPLSLIGFTAAYDGEGLDPAGAQSRQNELNAALQARAEEARKRLIERQRSQQSGGGG